MQSSLRSLPLPSSNFEFPSPKTFFVLFLTNSWQNLSKTLAHPVPVLSQRAFFACWQHLLNSQRPDLHNQNLEQQSTQGRNLHIDRHLSLTDAIRSGMTRQNTSTVIHVCASCQTAQLLECGLEKQLTVALTMATSRMQKRKATKTTTCTAKNDTINILLFFQSARSLNKLLARCIRDNVKR